MPIATGIVLYANGYDLAPWITSFELNGESDPLDATTLASTMREYEQGADTTSLEVEGIFGYDTVNQAAINDVLTDVLANRTDQIITWSLQAPAAGGDALMVNGRLLTYGTSASYGDLITVKAEWSSDTGMDAGKWLMHALVAAGTTNGAAVDGGGATADGGLFHVQLVNDDASDVDVKVQHSTTGVGAWVDLATVSNLSGDYAAGYIEVAAGTTVNRYLRASATVSGGDTLRIGATFARRY